eukprot:2546542-Amphidinium_carterae.2
MQFKQKKCQCVARRVYQRNFIMKDRLSGSCWRVALVWAFATFEGERVLIYLPLGITQIIWIEACKRLGVIYSCCSPLTPAKQLAERIFELRATAVLTANDMQWGGVVQRALVVDQAAQATADDHDAA